MMTSERLSMKEKLGYASGDLACNLVYQAISMFLLIFYVDVFGIKPSHAAILFLVARVWDAINDPIMGMIVDKTRTRFGKFRPYLLFGAIPFGIIAVLCFSTPALSATGKLIYAYVTYISLGMIYTVVNVPYGALSSSMTQDSNDRTSLSAVRMIFANLGGVSVAILMPLLVSKFGNGDQATGYQSTMILFAIIGALLLLITFVTTKERHTAVKQESIKVKDTINMIKSNRPLIIICLLFVVLFGNMAIGGSVGTFYYTYVLDNRMDLYGLITGLGMFLNVIVIVFVPGLAKKFEKKRLLMIALLITVFRPLSMIGGHIPLIIVGTIIGSIGSGIMSGLLWGLVPDTIEYGEWKTGVRAEGAVYAATGFFFKFGMALGGVLPGFVLEWTGYVANQPQTSTALMGINTLVIIIPTILSVLMLVIMKFYELDTETYNKILVELKGRKESIS